MGNASVGKTALTRAFCSGEFTEDYIATLGIDFVQTNYTVMESDEKIQVKCWDTAGQERFQNLAKNFYKRAEGIIVVYSVTDREAFEKIDSWLEQIQENAPPNTAVILVANKSDLDFEREVSKEEGLKLAASKNLPFFETSAKLGTDVKEAFTYVIETIYAKKMGRAAPHLVQRN